MKNNKSKIRFNIWMLGILTVVIPILTFLGAQKMYMYNKGITGVDDATRALATIDFKETLAVLMTIGAILTVVSFITTIIYWNHNR